MQAGREERSGPSGAATLWLARVERSERKRGEEASGAEGGMSAMRCDGGGKTMQWDAAKGEWWARVRRGRRAAATACSERSPEGRKWHQIIFDRNQTTILGDPAT